jgi:hypothetical protein
MQEIDDAVFQAAQQGEKLTSILERLHITGEVRDYHAKGEEAAVFPAVEKVAERLAADDQTAIVGLMSKSVPPEKFPVFIRWLFPLVGTDDRIVVIRGWMGLMPPPVFAGLKPLLQETMADDWAELTRRIPELA